MFAHRFNCSTSTSGVEITSDTLNGGAVLPHTWQFHVKVLAICSGLRKAVRASCTDVKITIRSSAVFSCTTNGRLRCVKSSKPVARRRHGWPPLLQSEQAALLELTKDGHAHVEVNVMLALDFL